MNTITIGIVGAGVIGSYHIDKCLRHQHVNLIGVFDADAQRGQAAADKFGVNASRCLDELLEQSDAVIVATPASTHAAITRSCLSAGKHVLVEKPLADSYAAGRPLVDLAARKRRVLHVGHSEAFNPAFLRLMALSPKPRFIEIHRLAAFSPRGTDVPVVLDLMVHDLHLIARLCNEEPVYHTIAATGVPVVSKDIDIANIRLSFPSGCIANVTASRISTKKMRKLRLFQKDNYYSVDLDKKEFVHCYLTTAQDGGRPVAQTREVLRETDALALELDAFVRAIAGNESANATPGAEALRVLRMTDAIMDRLKAV
jgi:predicted dehydrogenase